MFMCICVLYIHIYVCILKIDYLLTEYVFHFNIFFYLFTVLNNSQIVRCVFPNTCS